MTQAITVDELLAAYLDSHVASGHSGRTAEWYEYQVRRFLAWLQANDLHRSDWLHPYVIERYLAASRIKGNTPATIAGHYRGLHGFFGWLAQRGYIAASPMADMRPPKIPRKVPKRAQADEFTLLVDSIGTGDWVDLRDRLIIHVLFLCGLRRTECAKLAVDDFLLAEHLVLVSEGKGGNDRLVPLLALVQQAFVAYVFARPAGTPGALFLGANGARNPTGPITSNGIYQMVRRRCLAAGLRVLNPHSFRHGLAMHLLNEGADMSLVQKVLGHNQISTTAKHYAEWLTDGMLREFTETMGRSKIG